MEDHVSVLKKIFTSEGSVRPGSWNEVLTLIQIKNLREGDFFLMEGEAPVHLGFVSSGLFRAYIRDFKNRILCCNFFTENSFMMGLTSFISHRKNIVNIQALEDSVILSLDLRLFYLLFNRHKSLENTFLQIIEYAWAKREAHKIREGMYNESDRYHAFLEEFPGLENRISSRDLASYLRVTPLQLGRLRSGE